MNGHYKQLVILVIFQAIESNIFWLQLLKRKDLLLFFVINVCKSFSKKFKDIVRSILTPLFVCFLHFID